MNILILIVCIVIVKSNIEDYNCDRNLICGLKKIDKYVNCHKKLGKSVAKTIEAMYSDFLECNNNHMNLYLKIKLKKNVEKSNLTAKIKLLENKVINYQEIFKKIEDYEKKIDEKLVFKCLLFMFELILIQKIKIIKQKKIILLILSFFFVYVDSLIKFDCIFVIVLLAIS